MEFVLTDHAKEEAQRRQILLEWIETTMAQPEQVIPATNRRKVFQSRIVAKGKAYLVRLVVEDWHDPPVVVTVYRTSKIEKYWGKVMKANYDRQVDVLTVVFNDAPVEESDEVKPGVILDYDAVGNVVGMEILDASSRVANPSAMEFAVRAA